METLKDTIALTKEELRGLQVREDILMNKSLEHGLIKNERDMYWLSLVNKYKLDERKTYDVNKDGVITVKADKT